MAQKNRPTVQPELEPLSKSVYEVIESLEEMQWVQEREWVSKNVLEPLDDDIQAHLEVSARDRMQGTVKQRKQGLKRQPLPFVECSEHDMRNFSAEYKIALDNEVLPAILSTCLGTTEAGVTARYVKLLRSTSEISAIQEEWTSNESPTYHDLMAKLRTMRDLDIEWNKKADLIEKVNARTLLVAQVTSYYRSHVIPHASKGGSYSHDAYYPPPGLFRKFSDIKEQELTVELVDLTKAWEAKHGETMMVRGAPYLVTLSQSIWSEFEEAQTPKKKGKLNTPGGTPGRPKSPRPGDRPRSPRPGSRGTPGGRTPAKKTPGKGPKNPKTPTPAVVKEEDHAGSKVAVPEPLNLNRPISHERPARDPALFDPKNTKNRTVHVIESPNENANEGDPYITVACRIRPLMAHEGSSEAIATALPDGRSLKLSKAAKNKVQTSFELHYVADPNTNQVDFYEQCQVQSLFDKALEGQYVTMFAYGQTGSGKTYSMAGPDEVVALHERVRLEDPDGLVPEPVRDVLREVLSHELQQQGVMPRGCRYIFDRIVQLEEEDPNLRFEVRCDYVEIYNELLYDLLSDGKEALDVKMLGGEREGFYVGGLTEVKAETTDDVMSIFMDGGKNRQVASHALNRESSRSHALFSMTIDRAKWNPATKTLMVDRGKVTLVDLAGSESVKATGTSGSKLKETQGINTSLLHLSNIISGIAKDRTDDAARGHGFREDHIPWRNSKLTMLLMESLANIGSTMMLANISPSSDYLPETTNTLTFATKACNIKGKSIKNVSKSSHPELDSLRAKNNALEKEVERLKQLLDQAKIAY